MAELFLSNTENNSADNFMDTINKARLLMELINPPRRTGAVLQNSETKGIGVRSSGDTSAAVSSGAKNISPSANLHPGAVSNFPGIPESARGLKLLEAALPFIPMPNRHAFYLALKFIELGRFGGAAGEISAAEEASSAQGDFFGAISPYLAPKERAITSLALQCAQIAEEMRSLRAGGLL